MEWQPIETAPKNGDILIDIWCVPPDGCDFQPIGVGGAFY